MFTESLVLTKKQRQQNLNMHMRGETKAIDNEKGVSMELERRKDRARAKMQAKSS